MTCRPSLRCWLSTTTSWTRWATWSWTTCGHAPHARSGHGGAGQQRPDLTGLGEYGHSDQFYLRLDAQVAGIASVELPPELTAEQEAQLDLETNAAFEEFFEKQLIRLERRLTQRP
jgi:hypothetical protein